MPRLVLIPLLFCLCLRAQEKTVWTNTAGRSFTARLVTLTDTHALFAMPDGGSNRLAVTALHPACQRAARHAFQLPEIPATLRATFNLTVDELRRIRFQHEDGRLDETAHADFQRRLLNGFRLMYARHGLPDEERPALEQRLLNASRQPRE